jgi:hypothetical protein
MKPPSQKEALQQVARRLAELLDVPLAEVDLRQEPQGHEIDAIATVGDLTFVIEWKSSGATAPVSAAAHQARRYASELGGGAVPLVAVPFMGPVGRRLCQEVDVAWLDLSGNARIFAPGIRVRIEGQPNRFKHAGRPSSAFAPKSARIARWLLMHPDRSAIQREIAQETDVAEGFTSRIVGRLAGDDLIVREPSGAIRARDPELLLDAWSEAYDFSKYHIHRGHVAARSGDALLRRVADELERRGDRYAATGLAAAWLLTKWAGFRTVTVYIDKAPDADLRKRLGFREEEQGANLWLTVPNDEGVFAGAAEHDGVHCVHPVQAYLDVKQHPERATEAAERLRRDFVPGRKSA